MNEPTLLDIYAMFAMHALLNAEPAADEMEIAAAAYGQAQAMMQEREHWIPMTQ